MSDDKKEEIKFEEVTLKKGLIQGTDEKVKGDKITVSTKQKIKLQASGHI